MQYKITECLYLFNLICTLFNQRFIIDQTNSIRISSYIFFLLFLPLFLLTFPNTFNNLSNTNSLQSVYAQSFGDIIQITDGPDDNFFPHVASSGNNVYVVWERENNGDSDILFTRSIDGGTTFSEPIQLSDDPAFSLASSIAIDDANGNIYTAWRDTTTFSDIKVSKSVDEGLSFSEPLSISNPPFTTSTGPSIAAHNNNVYAIWQVFNSINPLEDADIFFASSTDGGITFSNPLKLSNDNPFVAFFPSLAIYENNIYATWTEEERINGEIIDVDILFTKSNDGGVTFDPPVEIMAAEGRVGLPGSIAAVGENIYIVVEHRIPETNRDEVFLLISRDGGNTFAPEDVINISQSPDVSSDFPQISISENSIVIVWTEQIPLAQRIFISASTDEGMTFGVPASIPNQQFSNSLSDIDLSDNKINVVWASFTGQSADLFFVSGILEDTDDIIPPETEIISVTDGNNNILTSGDNTVSTSVNIEFVGSDDITQSSQLTFECNLDFTSFVNCNSPIIIDNLDTGSHTFEVHAIDEAGNTDETPVEFTWTILTTAEGIEEIETIIDSFNLSTGVENSLKAKLSQASELLDDGNPNNDIAVCEKLDSFILEVDKKFFDGQLSAEYATLLIEKANAISNEIGC